MKRKSQILDKIISVETRIEFIVRNLNSKNISVAEVLDNCKEQLTILSQLRDMIEAEA